MSAFQTPTKSLPSRPSAEHLRKEAKRVARDDGIQLAAAQRQLAQEYGVRNWAELMDRVLLMSQSPPDGSDTENDRSQMPLASSEPTGGILPLVPLRELIAFPHVVYPIIAGRVKTKEAILYAKRENVDVVLVAQRNSFLANPSESDLHPIGTIGILLNIVQLPDGTVNAAVHAKDRARVRRFILDDAYYKAEIEKIAELALSDSRGEALVKAVRSACDRTNRLAGCSEARGAELQPSELADRIASDLQVSLAEKQALLEVTDPIQRLEKLLEHLSQ